MFSTKNGSNFNRLRGLQNSIDGLGAAAYTLQVTDSVNSGLWAFTITEPEPAWN